VISEDEDGAWTAAVIRAVDWHVATPDEIAEDERIRAHNAVHTVTDWLRPIGVTTRDGFPMAITTTHGLGQDDTTLCGIPEIQVAIYRHAFYGTGPKDCAVCAAKLIELASAANRGCGPDR
jgi:hypothetical protein